MGAGSWAGAAQAAGAERVARYSFELARKKGMNRVTAVDKVNVLGEMYEIWRESVRKVAADYPDIQLEFTLIDAITMFFVRKPEWCQVVIAPNLFGDIITDLGAGIVGGMGMAPGANINPETGFSMFEPIHGSGPDIAGKGIANPIAAILAGSMMLEQLGEDRAAKLVEDAVSKVLEAREIRTPDLGGHGSTVQVGDAVVAQILRLGERARKSPCRGKDVVDVFRRNTNSLAQLRAPIYEDKVVDFILELANVTEKKVTREDLLKDDEDEKTAA